MFLFEITEKGIEKVSIRAASSEDEARDLRLWPIVKRGLQRLNRDIERQLQTTSLQNESSE
jgi:hypothetical protein